MVNMKLDNVSSKLRTILDVPSQVCTGPGMVDHVKDVVLRHLKRVDRFLEVVVLEAGGIPSSKMTNPPKS